jgi:hypothetical protein
LTSLDFSRNKLRGWLPPAVLEGWAGLRSLSLHHNFLIGPLPGALRCLKVGLPFSLSLYFF